MLYQKAVQINKQTLYIVATPIGNLDDISIRALNILRNVDIIAAEDTRITATLLRYYGIQVPLLNLREQNEALVARRIIDILASNKSVAQVSDAGTPSICDPGALLCQKVRQAGFTIVPIPGPSACISALSASGFNYPHFHFYGFLPNKATQRQTVLASLRALSALLVFYEAPHRIIKSLGDCCQILGLQRKALLARELTKTFETLYQGTLNDLLQFVQADPYQQKGEFVLIIDAPEKIEGLDFTEMDRLLKPLLAVLSIKQAAYTAAKMSHFSRHDLYQRALALKSVTELNKGD